MTIPFLTPRSMEGEGGQPGIATSGSSAVLPIRLVCQEEGQWCWAAITQAVEDWRGSVVSQSEVASHHIAPDGGLVCATPLGDAGGQSCAACAEGCGDAHYLSAVLAERNRLKSSPINNPPTFNAIRRAIDVDRRPIPLRIDWGAAANNSGHFVCVVGYKVDGTGKRWVSVFDPLSPGVGEGATEPLTMRFADLVGNATYAASSGSGGSVNYMYEVQ
jgi:Papain-like cysteine protease AvrRpt2